MTVESVTYISDLNASYPAGSDAKSEGDDHIRNIKTGLLATFPSVTGAVTATHTELNYVDVTTAGTAQASKAMILDSSKGITGITSLTGTTVTGTTVNASTTLQIGGVAVTATAAELNYCDVTTAGTAQASKAVVLDSSSKVTGIAAINNSPIGLDTASTGAFTTVTATGTITSTSAISGYVTGVTEYLQNDTGAAQTAFNVAANIGGAWESVGPTGSGATNIWTSLDSVPANAKWVEIVGTFDLSSASTPTASGYLYCRKTGSSTGLGADNQVARGNIDVGTGTTCAVHYEITRRIPVDSSNRFDLYLSTSNTVACSIYLAGFGI